jgi:DNA replication and repair protein RecF
MRLTALSADGFKNLESVSLIPDPSYNLILGENAQGKTNILEAVYVCCTTKSHRGAAAAFVAHGNGTISRFPAATSR